MNEFNIGDIVRVVDEPYRSCPFHWAENMSNYLGMAVTICAKTWSPANKTYRYEIKEDNRRFAWCGDCFTLNYSDDFEIEDSDALLELLSIVPK